MTQPRYDAVLVVSFGGPEGPDDVLPFLDRVLAGKPVPPERKLEVAEHYQHFGGVSPINEQNRRLIDALREELASAGHELPVFFGNRNWHPLLPDAIREMSAHGVRRALALVTSAYSCYSGCRQYRENLLDAIAEVGADAPQIEKIRVYYNHPGYIEATTDRVQEALDALPAQGREQAHILFTAHSIPLSMAGGSRYVEQLEESCRLVGERLGRDDGELVYQSRSGPPQQPWLEPDICDRIEALAGEGARDLVIMPIGFVSDHMEVLFDLDTEAREICDEKGIRMVRAATVGTHPAFIRGLRELIEEKQDPSVERKAVGHHGPYPEFCPKGCCAYEHAARRPGKGGHQGGHKAG